MTAVLLATNAVLALLAGVLGYYHLKARAERKERGLFRRWPIPTVPLQQLDPRFALGPFGPTAATEVAFIGRGALHVLGGTSDVEAWVLAVLAKGARHCFEFGTCTGKTAYLWARNLPPDGRVTTLTLPPEQLGAYTASAADDPEETRVALHESRFTRFLYSGTDAERRIVQLFGDSKGFDEAPFSGECDVVLVDGSHAFSYVVSDSEKALRMVAPGGIVLWHDYSHKNRGVFRALNGLAKTLPLVHLAGTSFVAYRKPTEV